MTGFRLRMRHATSVAAALAGVIGITSVGAQSRFRPAQFLDGTVPTTVSPLAVGGGQVLLELTVGKDGRVANLATLRATPPFAEALTAAVRTWRFRPAERLVEPLPPNRQPSEWQPVEAKVLVASVIRPPTINTPTLGEPPKEVAPASADTPFPTNIVTPLFPPRARDAGTVLVEVVVGPDGTVIDARVLRSSPAFDASALTATRAWSFRPARVRGVAVSSNAYAVFVFRQPVTQAAPTPGRRGGATVAASDAGRTRFAQWRSQ